MTTPAPPRVVLDTVVFVQALISGRGPAAVCIDPLRVGRFVLLLSNALLAELHDVPLRPALRRKYTYLTPARVEAFIAEINDVAVVVADPPPVFSLPRDPKDEPLIDLSVAGGADYLVTRNHRHLNYLMDRNTPEGIDFCNRFPSLRIVTPPQFLGVIEVTHP